MSPTLFTHIAVGERTNPPLFLLHGTGGSEHDLLHLVEKFADTHSLVGLRGNVKERGQFRFFKRFAEGLFDYESIKNEAEKLRTFFQTWHQEYQLDSKRSIYIGYSNGANMLLALLFLYPDLISNAGLLHPMLPLSPTKQLDFSEKKIFISWSPNDPIISEEESKKLIQTLKNFSAQLQVLETTAGHSLEKQEVVALHAFIDHVDSTHSTK